MSVLIFAENWEGKFKKATFETVSYGARVAKAAGGEAVAVVFGTISDDLSVLGTYGAARVLHYNGDQFQQFNNQLWAACLAEAANETGAKTVVLSGTFNGKAIQGMLAVKLQAALITNCVALPSSTAPVKVRRSAFSSKGFVDYEAQTDRTVISIVPNAVGVESISAAGSVENKTTSASANAKVLNVDRVRGQVPLPEAELVVSGGRGMKGPENWNLIEELAEALGASTACSKPVSDMHWRPHSEHVGQTGIAIRPNLYIAVGISGAIQHLAGVSNSKTIVVINSDPEAPFFKAADYGIVGDAFEVLPKLTAAVKALKANA